MSKSLKCWLGLHLVAWLGTALSILLIAAAVALLRPLSLQYLSLWSMADVSTALAGLAAGAGAVLVAWHALGAIWVLLSACTHRTLNLRHSAPLVRKLATGATIIALSCAPASANDDNLGWGAHGRAPRPLLHLLVMPALRLVTGPPAGLVLRLLAGPALHPPAGPAPELQQLPAPQTGPARGPQLALVALVLTHALVLTRAPVGRALKHLALRPRAKRQEPKPPLRQAASRAALSRELASQAALSQAPLKPPPTLKRAARPALKALSLSRAERSAQALASQLPQLNQPRLFASTWF